MSVEFMHPLRLLALPACAAVVLAICLIRRSRSRKERISHFLRYIIIALAVLALAGTGLLTASPDRTAFLVVDVSASVNEEETLRLAREALERSGDRQTGVIAFGGNAAVERSLSQTAPLGDLTARVDRSASDLNSALQLASALLPADSNGGIAVISDGRVTGEEDFFRSAGGLLVNVLKTETRSGTDAQITSVSVPSSLYTGQKYTTVVTVHANTAGEATLLLTRDRGEAQTRTVTLRKGENTFAFDAVAGDAGVSTVEAQDYFDHLYLSYQCKQMKPSPEIFQIMLNGQQVCAEETLFIDDGKKNVEAAAAIGMHTLCPENNADWTIPLSELLL